MLQDPGQLDDTTIWDELYARRPILIVDVFENGKDGHARVIFGWQTTSKRGNLVRVLDSADAKRSSVTIAELRRMLATLIGSGSLEDSDESPTATTVHDGCHVGRSDLRAKTYDQADKAMGRICRRAKLPRLFHTLRHTFGTHAALFGVNPWRLQAWLGHKRIDETMLYVHVAEATRATCPRS